MEALHRDTYRERWQKRWNEMAADAQRRLAALREDNETVVAPDNAVLAAWRRERPAMLNDTRKLMAASLLLLAPPVDGR
ncbi:MAG: hypothetical protein A49_29710 [Methyloceanibacter sp.]|nr:MAG: hypothetical protein A49_29710 [Methyloceanibacter sp.]